MREGVGKLGTGPGGVNREIGIRCNARVLPHNQRSMTVWFPAGGLLALPDASDRSGGTPLAHAHPSPRAAASECGLTRYESRLGCEPVACIPV